MKCPTCGVDNTSSAKYCIECGTPLFKKCDICGTITILNAKFCPNCGKQFEALDIKVIKYKNKLTFYDLISIQKAKSGKYIVAKNSNKYILLDINTLLPIFDYSFEEYPIGRQKEYQDFCFVKKNGKWGIINPLAKKCITGFIYDDYKTNDHSGSEFRVLKDGYWGKVDANTGSTTIPHIYDEIEHDGRVKQHGYWGWLGIKGLSVPCEYISLSWYNFSDNIRPSQHKSGKWGVINCNGDKLIEFEYDEIEYHEPCGHSVYYLRKGTRWGLYCEGNKYPCTYAKEELSKLKWW